MTISIDKVFLGSMNVGQFLARELTCENQEVVKIVSHGGHYFAAVKIGADVVGVAIKISANNAHTLTYKILSEDMHPYYYAPASILKLLTPTTNENSLSWRTESQKRIDAANRLKNLSNGQSFEKHDISHRGKNLGKIVITDAKRRHIYSHAFSSPFQFTKEQMIRLVSGE